MKSKRGAWDEIVIDELGKRIIGYEKEREIVFTFMLGRLVDNSKPATYNLLLKGNSTTGKDWLVSNVASLFLEEDLEYFGRATPKAINYLHDKNNEPNFTYDGKMAYFEEITEPTLNGEVMLVWTSGKNKMISVERGKAIVKEVEGKPVILATSFRSIPIEEILNRFALIHLDLTENQRKAIKKQRAIVVRDGFEEDYSNKCKSQLAGLKHYSVRIPYAVKINKHLPNKIRGESRTIDRIYGIIQAVAIFFQEDKHRDKDGFIDADNEDYEIARGIIENMTFGFPDFLLADIQKRVVDFLKKQKEPKQAQEILQRLGDPMTIQNFRPHLQRLVNLKKIEAIPLWNEKNYSVDKYQIVEELNNPENIKLPAFEEL